MQISNTSLYFYVCCFLNKYPEHPAAFNWINGNGLNIPEFYKFVLWNKIPSVKNFVIHDIKVLIKLRFHFSGTIIIKKKYNNV